MRSGALTRRRGGSASAWDLVARGCSYFHQVTQPTHRKARDLFLEARELDPELAEAWIWLARVDAGILAFGWNDDAEEIRREGLAAAHEAVRRDEKNCYAHYSLAIVYFSEGRVAEARDQWATAARLDPSSELGRRSKSFVDLLKDAQSSQPQPAGD